MTEAAGVATGDRSSPSARREAIRSRVLRDGFARIDDLAAVLGVSIMTVHRDLDSLAGEGWLTKIRGGATANPAALVQTGVRERTATMSAEKTAIAACAAQFLHPGQTVFLDDSTTALALLPHIADSVPTTVASNFLPVLAGLGRARDIELIALGGVYSPVQEACFGMQTIEAIGQLHADVLFMSTTALTRRACYHRSEVTVMSRRAYMQNTELTVLLVDHAKFGRRSPHLLCPVDAVDVVVTDAGIDGEDLEELRQRDVRVEVAHVDG